MAGLVFAAEVPDDWRAQVESRRVTVARSLIVPTALVSFVAAIVVLAGWGLHEPRLTAWGFIGSQHPNTALTSALLALGILTARAHWRWPARALFVSALMILTTMAVENIAARPLLLDAAVVNVFDGYGPGRLSLPPSIEGVVSLSLLAIAAIFATLSSIRMKRTAAWLSFAAGCIILVGYVELLSRGISVFPWVEESVVSVPGAIQTSGLFLAVQLSIAATSGMIKELFVDASVRARLKRRIFLPVVFGSVVPVVVATIRLRTVFPSNAALVAQGGVFMAFVLGVVVWFSGDALARAITKRLERISQSAANVRRGSFGTPIRFDGTDEIGQLARDFDQMRATLEERERLNVLAEQVRVVVGRATTLEVAFREFSSLLQPQFGWLRTVYYEIDTSGPTMTNVYLGSGPPTPRISDLHIPLQPENYPVPRGVSRVDPEDVRLFLGRDVATFAYVMPIIVANEMTAGVVFVYEHDEDFTPARKAAVQVLVDAATSSFHHLQLLAREKEINERLTSIDQMRSVFVGAVAHDLRLPMSVIANTADLLHEDWDMLSEDERQQYLGTISKRVRTLSAFVDEMLDVARIDSGDLAPEVSSIDLGAVAQGVLTEVQQAYPAHRFVLHREGNDLMVCSDERFQWQILENLMANAAKFSEPGSTVDVSLQVAAAEVEIRVRDTGVGIPPQELGRVFDKFHRVESALSTRGSGLGLYISQQLLRTQSRAISVESVLGQGSVFSYRLPRANSTKQAVG